MTLAIPRPDLFAAWGASAIVVILFLAGMTVALELWIDPALAEILTRSFWIDLERNVPTAFSFALIAGASMLSLLIAWQQFACRSPWRFHWAGLGALLLYIAFDEAAQIHEMFNVPMAQVMPDVGAFRYAWVGAGAAFALVAGIVFLRFVLALPNRVRLLIAASGATFLSGALGMEMLAASTIGVADPWITYRKLTMAEEGLEMAGMLLFSTALLTLLRQEAPGTAAYLRGARG